VGKRLDLKTFVKDALAASATAVLLAIGLPANQAMAASAECHGVIGHSTDPGDLPVDPTSGKSNFNETMSFTKGSPATSAAKKAVNLQGSFYLAVDQPCQGFGATASQTPCVVAGSFTGTIPKGSDTMTLNFDNPSSGSGLFKGCSMTYLVQTAQKNTVASFIGTSLLTGGCKPQGSRMVFACTENN
jgi:hypothetical protein